MKLSLPVLLVFGVLTIPQVTFSQPKPALPPALRKPIAQQVVPTNGMRITKSTTLKPGTYQLDRGIEIAADGVTLDGNGAVLIGKDHKGTAVRVSGRRGVTIQNLSARCYYHGIRIEKSKDVTVQKCNVTDTAELEPGRNWLDIWLPASEAYGAAVMLVDAERANVRSDVLAHQQNGILMYNCSGCTVEMNNTCYQSGYGIHLYGSSNNTIQDNLSDFCNRVHQRRRSGDYVGADATGMLMVRGSCNNRILRNKFRSGGDGVFIAGFSRGEIAPCNNNLFEENDCSLSPNNAFESTFCDGNIFRKNKANQSNYGFWLGFSTKNEVIDNDISNNRFAGIAIDTGNTNSISKNRITNNRFGIMLWVSSDPAFVKEFPQLVQSHTYTIEDNTFRSNRVGLNSVTAVADKTACNSYIITGNTFDDNRIGVRLERNKDCRIEKNTFVGNQVGNIKLIGSTGITATENNELPAPDYDADSRVLNQEVR